MKRVPSDGWELISLTLLLLDLLSNRSRNRFAVLLLSFRPCPRPLLSSCINLRSRITSNWPVRDVWERRCEIVQIITRSYTEYKLDKLYIEEVSVLTTGEAADSQGLGRVQGQTVLAVLDVGHGGHGVEIGLQWYFLEVPAWLDLRGNNHNVS